MKIDVDFKDVRIAKVSNDKSSFNIVLSFLENGILQEHTKECNVNNNVESFVSELLQEVKQNIKFKHEDPYNEDLLNILNINIVEKEEGYMEQVIINAIKRMKDNVRNLKSMRTADEYMNTFLAVRDQKIKLGK